MSGTHAMYPTQLDAAKPHSPRTLIILFVLLALIGAGGSWVYFNSLGSQSLTQAAAVQPPDVGASNGVIAGNGLQTTTADSAAAASQAPTPAAAQPVAAQTVGQSAEPAANPAAISGVAGVDGAPVWGDDGALIATLESGSIMSIKARASDNAWLSVETEAGSGWTEASAVVAYGLHRLTTMALPDMIASAASSASIADLTLADLVPGTPSPADGSQLEQAGSGQVTAKVAATGSRLNVRSGPGTDYLVIAKAGDGAEYLAIGRNEASDWLLLQLSDDASDVGWVSAGYVDLSGDIQTLPVEHV